MKSMARRARSLGLLAFFSCFFVQGYSHYIINSTGEAIALYSNFNGGWRRYPERVTIEDYMTHGRFAAPGDHIIINAGNTCVDGYLLYIPRTNGLGEESGTYYYVSWKGKVVCTGQEVTISKVHDGYKATFDKGADLMFEKAPYLPSMNVKNAFVLSRR